MDYLTQLSVEERYPLTLGSVSASRRSVGDYLLAAKLAGNVRSGRIARLLGSPRQGPESGRKQSFHREHEIVSPPGAEVPRWQREDLKASAAFADLSGTNLRRADLRDADLSGANLSRATLIETHLENTVLTGCRVYGILA